MKKVLPIAALLIAVIFLFPMGFNAVFSLSARIQRPESIELKINGSGEGKTVTLSPADYVTGCLFAQIPIDYEKEALKAQAVCAYTYALKLLENGKELSNDTALCQPYFSQEQAKTYYGDEYEQYLPAIKEAAQYGVSNALTYDGELIYSVYHSVSTGKTARCEYVWEVNFPYLAPVNSPWDTKYVNFETSNEITTEQMRVFMLNYDRSLNMPLDYSEWFTNANIDEWGYTLSINVGGRTLSGGDVWRILKLRSTAFEITYNGDVFIVKTKGFGHGAGLSQYGANEMAKGGKCAEEILKYYFSGVDIVTF